LIILAFFLPLAIYCLVLGLINRRRHPLVISGVWDGIGLVFGASGFLLFAGPAVLSAVSERWRWFWLFGKGNAALPGPDGAWPFWIFLSILYFVLIVGGAAFYFRRQRCLTAVYNADVVQVEQALAEVCDRLGLHPARSGGLFVFGPSLGGEPSEDRKGAEQALSYDRGSSGEMTLAATIREQSAILEVDSFPLMRHVTLRWDPVESPFRRILETELSRCLEEMPSEDNLLGSWLLMLGLLLLVFELAGAFVLILLHLTVR
jgi:hypothetical protein